ncbi:MAG: ABC transporter, partial [Clostridia bacterium]|nr:ABC transporter [Clostridia bacterium]
MFAIYKRDLRSYFTTPIGYVFVAVFLAVNGGLFSLNTLQKGTESDVGSYFSALILGLILVVPLLTMKVFS